MRLTDKDREIILFIQSRLRIYGQPPLYREIADAFGVTITTIFKRVDKLTRYGLISHQIGRHRRIIPTVLGREWAAGRVSTQRVKQRIYEEQT